MQFRDGTALYSYETQREGGEDVLYVNYLGAPFVPSIADSPEVMERTIDALMENPNVSRVVFVQQKNYNYNFNETSALLELAQLYVYLIRQERVLSKEKLVTSSDQFFAQRYNEIFSVLYSLKRDPVVAYLDTRSYIVEGKILLDKLGNQYKLDQNNYIRLLEKIFNLLQNTKLIQNLLDSLRDYQKGDREIYHKILEPDIIPNFTFTRLVSAIPDDVEIIDQYKISSADYDESVVTILKKKNESKFIYHLLPPENSIDENYNMLLNLARNVLIEHQPKAEEFTDTERTRQVFFNISKDLLRDLAQSQGINLNYSDLNKLAKILVRHTIGFGLIEVLLQDKNIQDIVLNAPIPQTNIFLKHETYDECYTNILPSQEDVDSWAAKFRMISGRPLDEANPVLDTQLEVDNMRARIAIIQQPLSPNGLAYAIRRHREDPWTFPLFIKNKMMNSLSAGLLSFLIDGGRTMLIAGTRSSGKTSLLGSLMLEILPRTRIIIIEDTLELPFESMKKLNYDILQMKVRSALLNTTNEISADDGIRTSLRLGDSSLIVGEVRSAEAKALYEAMRVGALANTVAGTIHGASPYAVFDRVVNDLEVPATSFKATDIIAVANPIKSPDGLHSWKRLLQISEVRKFWKKDPLEENGFSDLLKYNVEKDELEASDNLINGDSDVVKAIAENVKGWAGNWDAVYDNILLRAKTKEELLKLAEKTGNEAFIEAEFNVWSNQAFHSISDEIRSEIGLPLSNRVFPAWQEWLNKEVKKKSL